MKEIKQKPAGGKPKTADAARVPKAVVKAAWLQAREAARAGEKQVVGGKDGAYSGAADTGEKGADKLVSTGERVTELAYRGGRKLAERSAGQRRERAKAAQTGGEAAQRHGAGETIAHTSTIEASRPPQTREAGRVSDENRPAGARPQQRESRAVGRAKPIKPGREMKQGAPGPKTTEQAGKARQAVQAAARNGQAKARFTQRAQQTAKRAVDTTKRATDAARAGMRALVEALHSLLIALAAGGSVAVLIVVLICLIAFVAGSAYGIFFAAEAPGEDAFTVQQAVEQLGGEYRDYLQQIESTMPHDRQEFQANNVLRIIRHEGYTGYIITKNARSEYIPELQIIDKDTFDRANDIISRRSTKIKQEKQISHTCQNPTLLAGIVYCAHCGAKMSGFMHKDRYKLADGTIREKVQPKYNCFQRAQKSRGGRDCDGQSLYLAETVDAIVLEVVRKVFAQIRDTPYSRVAEQRIRQESNLQKVKRAAVEKKMRSAQHALERFEGEILKCLDGTSCFTEDMIAKQIRKSQKDLDDAKAEFVELQKERINETAEIRKLRSYYDDFRGWAEEFDSAPLEIKRTILSRLIDRVEVGRKYAVTIKFNISYQQFLKCDNTIEPRQEIGA